MLTQDGRGCFDPNLHLNPKRGSTGTSTHLIHCRTQHAVGQGGFHSAEVFHGESCFRYVYDCGSQDLTSLYRAIRQFAPIRAEKKLDCLFLSHLDEDHVNGVEQLLARVEPNDIVLPYLDFAERTVLLARSCAAGTLSQTYFDMITDPSGWFRARGAKRIVYVAGSQGDASRGEEGLGPQQDAPTEGKEKLGLELRGKLVTPDTTVHHDIDAAQDEHILPPGQPLHIDSNNRRGTISVWRLLPFSYPEPGRIDEFIRAVSRTLKFNPHKGTLAFRRRKLNLILGDRRKRIILANLYHMVRADRNLTSMSLYSGPELRNGNPNHGRVSWLGTGDMNLKRLNRWNAFEEFYGPLLDSIETVVIPHHGSRNNIDIKAISRMKDSRWIAPYGTRNRYRHPHVDVVDLVSAMACEMKRVTEHRSTEVRNAWAITI